MSEDIDTAELAFREQMERKPDHYDWLDIAYRVALQQSGPVGGPLWADFVERVRPRASDSA